MSPKKSPLLSQDIKVQPSFVYFSNIRIGLYLLGCCTLLVSSYFLYREYIYDRTLSEIVVFQDLIQNQTDPTKCDILHHDEMRSKCQDNLRSNVAIFSARPMDCRALQDDTLRPLCIKYASKAVGQNAKTPKECLDLPAEGATICQEFFEMNDLFRRNISFDCTKFSLPESQKECSRL